MLFEQAMSSWQIRYLVLIDFFFTPRSLSSNHLFIILANSSLSKWLFTSITCLQRSIHFLGSFLNCLPYQAWVSSELNLSNLFMYKSYHKESYIQKSITYNTWCGDL